MKLDEALEPLGISHCAERFRADWDIAQRAQPAGEIPFLRPEYVKWACGTAGLPPEFTEEAVNSARRVQADRALSAIVWYGHYVLFRSKSIPLRAVDSPLPHWPSFPEVLGRLAGMPYVLVVLSGTPQLLEFYRRRGIPESVFSDSAADLERRMREYHRDTGFHGISSGLLSWLTRIWVGDISRLGRLQFERRRFAGRLRVFRHSETRAVIALSGPGVRYRRDGMVDGAARIYDKECAWTATFCETDEHFSGHPVLPRGFAVSREIRLNKKEWESVLAPDDPVLQVHIPPGAPLTMEACDESLRRAVDFFSRHFPDWPARAFACSSWILDPQFEALLPATTNLVRFQKEVYLFPQAGGTGDMPQQVARRRDRETDKSPSLTTMQRAFLRHVGRGGRFYIGGCFLMIGDLNWGRQVYRSQKLGCLRTLARGRPPPPGG